MKLVVGLGNIGNSYELTRHNVGFMALEHFLGDAFFKDSKFAQTFSFMKNGEKILFIKPTTYMNLSGDAVKYYSSFYKINVQNILVIQDDLDLPLGKIRVKQKSSAGGHNGIKSIIASLNSDEFIRLKIGISKSTGDTCDYVLGKFTKNEFNVLNDTFNRTDTIIQDFIDGVDKNIIMNRYN